MISKGKTVALKILVASQFRVTWSYFSKAMCYLKKKKTKNKQTNKKTLGYSSMVEYFLIMHNTLALRPRTK
jgi:hypothetical protein